MWRFATVRPAEIRVTSVCCVTKNAPSRKPRPNTSSSPLAKVSNVGEAHAGGPSTGVLDGRDLAGE